MLIVDMLCCFNLFIKRNIRSAYRPVAQCMFVNTSTGICSILTIDNIKVMSFLDKARYGFCCP